MQGTLKASERIDQLKTEIADYRTKKLLEEMKLPENGGLDFLNKIMGNKDADHMESALNDPRTLLAAIIVYLDEKNI